MLKYMIFVIAYNGSLWDAYELNCIPEKIQFDCLDDAVFHLQTWMNAGSAQTGRTYVYLSVCPGSE